MDNRVFVPDLTAPPLAPRGAPFQFTGESMGTTWSVRGFTEMHTAPLQQGVVQVLDGIVREMSQWEATSDLSRFNALAPGAVAQLPHAFGEVLACALDVAAETEGAFDPSLGALVDLWGFGANPVHAAPQDEAIRAALAASGWRKLAYDADTRRLAQPGSLRLDFAGIAKGYAVDCVARFLSERGLISFLVEIGGEVHGRGVKPDGQPWWVEIERPPDGATQPIVAALCDVAVATSGDYRRHGMLSGQHVTHTIDPRTGRPLVTPITAVTVMHTECMLADAYATALMIMGVETGLAFADQHDIAAMFTSHGAQEAFSQAFLRQLG